MQQMHLNVCLNSKLAVQIQSECVCDINIIKYLKCSEALLNHFGLKQKVVQIGGNHKMICT